MFLPVARQALCEHLSQEFSPGVAILFRWHLEYREDLELRRMLGPRLKAVWDACYAPLKEPPPLSEDFKGLLDIVAGVESELRQAIV